MNSAVVDGHDDAVVAGWGLLQLVQQVEAARSTLGTEGVARLYARWLQHQRQQDGREALLGRFNLATLLQNMGRLAEAETAYREVLRGLDLAPARDNLAALLEQTGRHDEARALREAAAPPLPEPAEAEWAAVPEPVVYVFAVCFNEAAVLPHFLDHYIHHIGAKKVVLHDGGSTDGSAAIAARYPEVDFIVAPSEKLDDSQLMVLRNEAWKPYRSECDWVVVCDVDEFLWAPDIRRQLRVLKAQGVTLPMVKGFNICSKSHPPQRPGQFLWQQRQTGSGDARYLNKNLIFDPRIDINYTLGCHGCRPEGPVRRTPGFVFKSLHMCMLSYDIFQRKSARSAARLSDWNKQTNAGFHYRLNAGLSRAEFNAKFKAARNVVDPRPCPGPEGEAHAALREHLLGTALDARVLQLGVATGGGAADGGFGHGWTAWLAWFVHEYGGHLVCADVDPKLLRHAQRELARTGLDSPRLSLVAATLPAALPAALPTELPSGEPTGRYDLLLLSHEPVLGDASDIDAAQRQALLQFLDVQDRLAPDAWVVLAGGTEATLSRGTLLRQLLAGRGWQALAVDGLTVMSAPAA